jgi:hypothetical protein
MSKITKKEAALIQNIAIALAHGAEERLDEQDIAHELEEKFGIDTDSGAYRIAFILDNVVVKVSQDKRRQKMLVTEADFINKMRKDKQYGRHFPQTEVFTVGKVTLQIQEKVDMNHRNTWEMADEVEQLANSLGIEDMHSGNYGWKEGPNGKYPVFVDVDLRDLRRRGRRKKRSWMV